MIYACEDDCSFYMEYEVAVISVSLLNNRCYYSSCLERKGDIKEKIQIINSNEWQTYSKDYFNTCALLDTWEFFGEEVST